MQIEVLQVDADTKGFGFVLNSVNDVIVPADGIDEKQGDN